ncbi:Acetyl-CoA:oxalate CoA-transferase [Cupriavidus yeoncheonensis]|uniref:Acetyl-CoA:oxalate CoA-transferase n=1 Tax=Cupriavidus yeoncheonensis TaxID=1462994 RepID=A0A916N434_9BURK|nr:CaiB/BaiF CoA-transferase family protein [Cupriavidus yeoncheonensis]CAG2144015.1 Acetyl-CoA:oxalate CoA-transferase [Cupriavidus yeoncheonensis]
MDRRTPQRKGPLSGIRVLEVAGIGPGPFCGMLLADLGADVVVVDRPQAGEDAIDLGAGAISRRGKRSLALDLKAEAGRSTMLRLVEHCDALIEGMRPGVMERLGLGPDTCLRHNPSLVYGRMTGWGQDGPLAQAAGHDINYIALSGSLWYAGQPGEPPMAPPSLVGDIGGGAMYLVAGLLAGLLQVRAGGPGQVVDAAIVDGSAHMTSLLLGLQAGGHMQRARGRSMLDGPHWYNAYRCADGEFITVGALEPKFYRELRERLGLADDPAYATQHDADQWPALRERLAALFATRDRATWCELLEGTDACFAPVLSPDEAAAHPHLRARGVYTEADGVLQASPAPRFSGTPAGIPGPIPRRGEHSAAVLADWLIRR